MSDQNITMSKYMTTEVKTLPATSTIEEAQNMMAELGFRHLPVMEGDKLIGIISDRDIKLAHSLYGIDAALMSVRDNCILSPHTVDVDANLYEVADAMAKYRYGCVIITKDNAVAGIFTTVDACKLLADLLRDQSES
ncbi:MAG: acetoin utilization protein AcuB [Candidatus Omnitrophota bacterium]|jgi:acetoin utilization protein AcuB